MNKDTIKGIAIGAIAIIAIALVLGVALAETGVNPLTVIINVVTPNGTIATTSPGGNNTTITIGGNEQQQQPTPIIIYVTPQPTQEPTPIVIIITPAPTPTPTPTPSPTPIITPSPTPAPTLRPYNSATDNDVYSEEFYNWSNWPFKHDMNIAPWIYHYQTSYLLDATEEERNNVSNNYHSALSLVMTSIYKRHYWIIDGTALHFASKNSSIIWPGPKPAEDPDYYIYNDAAAGLYIDTMNKYYWNS
jgi:hypothetical protein